MAGIYIHIPFCKTRCTYCDFFSSTNFSSKNELIETMKLEIVQRKNYLNEPVETIYFGGGTPSLLSIDEIRQLLETIFQNFSVTNDAEITLEANPDDLSVDFLNQLRTTGVNRLSMGIQSLDDEQLKMISRRHTAEEAVDAIRNAQNAGFDNISIDLIYGLPSQSFISWQNQVDKALEMNIQHLSAYALTYEKNTALWNQMKNGKIMPTDDDTIVAMYKYLIDKCKENHFEHYEISNFAKKGFRSRHNSAYWKQKPYLGIGPAAHSYDLISRQWNVSNIKSYIQLLKSGKEYFEKEVLNEQDKYNDFVMVSLRTMDGINLRQLEELFGKEKLVNCLSEAKKHLENNLLALENDFLHLTTAGIMVSDSIIVDLMIV